MRPAYNNETGFLDLHSSRTVLRSLVCAMRQKVIARKAKGKAALRGKALKEYYLRVKRRFHLKSEARGQLKQP